MKEELLRMAERKRTIRKRKAVEETVTKLMGPGNYAKYIEAVRVQRQAQDVIYSLEGLPLTLEITDEVEELQDVLSQIKSFMVTQSVKAETVGKVAELANSVVEAQKVLAERLACTPKIRLQLEEIEALKAKLEDI